MFVGALQLMLDLGKEHDWFESGLIVRAGRRRRHRLRAFVIWELGEKHPIVNLRVFRHRGYTTAVIVIAAGFGAMFAANVLTPLWLQSYMGYTSTWAGTGYRLDAACWRCSARRQPGMLIDQGRSAQAWSSSA